MKFTRREFVTAAAGAALLAPEMVRAAESGWAFPAVSGRRMFGLLVSHDPLRHEAGIAALRRETSYFRPLAYTSTDRNKAAFAAAVIDYRHAAGLDFTARPTTAPDIPAGMVMGERNRFPELYQLSAFLTGCAYGAWAGTGHPLKRGLIERFAASAA